MERERAIEIVEKHYYPDGVDDTLRRALETLIPELAESEDERIRKWIVENLSEQLTEIENEVALDYDYRTESMKKKEVLLRDALAWLEKQKEEGYEAIPVESTLEYKLGFKAGKDSEKQKEQKPAEWSEEDEKVIEAACALLCEYAGYYKEKDMEAKDVQLFKLSQRLKSLPERFRKEQNKVIQIKGEIQKNLKATENDIQVRKDNGEDTDWYEGKRDGYSDAIAIINASFKWDNEEEEELMKKYNQGKEEGRKEMFNELQRIAKSGVVIGVVDNKKED